MRLRLHLCCIVEFVIVANALVKDPRHDVALASGIWRRKRIYPGRSMRCEFLWAARSSPSRKRSFEHVSLF
jgi:hypothetical protein